MNIMKNILHELLLIIYAIFATKNMPFILAFVIFIHIAWLARILPWSYSGDVAFILLTPIIAGIFNIGK